MRILRFGRLHLEHNGGSFNLQPAVVVLPPHLLHIVAINAVCDVCWSMHTGLFRRRDGHEKTYAALYTVNVVQYILYLSLIHI